MLAAGRRSQPVGEEDGTLDHARTRVGGVRDGRRWETTARRETGRGLVKRGTTPRVLDKHHQSSVARRRPRPVSAIGAEGAGIEPEPVVNRSLCLSNTHLTSRSSPSTLPSVEPHLPGTVAVDGSVRSWHSRPRWRPSRCPTRDGRPGRPLLPRQVPRQPHRGRGRGRTRRRSRAHGAAGGAPPARGRRRGDARRPLPVTRRAPRRACHGTARRARRGRMGPSRRHGRRRDGPCERARAHRPPQRPVARVDARHGRAPPRSARRGRPPSDRRGRRLGDDRRRARGARGARLRPPRRRSRRRVRRDDDVRRRGAGLRPAEGRRP